jgi:uncharacterized membrane protein (UPF0127 family)
MRFVVLPSAVFATLLPILAAASQSGPATQPLTIQTQAGERRLTVEIADDDAEREKGLMFRRAMDVDKGMLFDFGVDRGVSMWMKNTYIPLDMLFIDRDGIVRTVARRTTPLSERTINSDGPVRYVLEIDGGVADALGVRPGDKVTAAAIGAK